MSTSDEPPVYRHVQHGRFVQAALLTMATAALIGTLFEMSTTSGGRFVSLGLIAVPVLLLVSQTFGSMTIEVSPSYVRWWFGIGWPGGRIARSELAGISITNPSFFNGIGVHLTLRGWLWNVSLGQAVRLQSRSGAAVSLGTDEPGSLLAALERA